MQSFAVIEDYLEALLNGFRRDQRDTYTMGSEYIRESTEEHLLHFSKQILIVEDVKMAQVKEGLVPRKLNQWLKMATDLKGLVSEALKKQQNSKDPSTELKEMCTKIFEYMKDCPIEVVNDKPMAYIARLHEAEDGTSIALSGEDGVQVHDVEKAAASSDEKGKLAITPRSQGGIISFLESYYGRPRILREEMGGESSRVHDSLILETSPKDSGFHYTSEIQDGTVIKESYAPKGMPIRSVVKLAVLKDINLRRHEKMPIGETDLNNVLINSTDIGFQPRLNVEKNPQESNHHMIQILLNGEMSKYIDLGVQILSRPPTQPTCDLNNDFGLHGKADSYLFFAMKKPDNQITLMANGASLLPGDLVVDKSGPRSQEMLNDEEWNRAGVLNLIEKKVRVLNVEPHCPNLVILLLQRNSRLTDICSSFFKQMPALRFLDLSDTRIKVLPSSIFHLINLQVLLFRGCVCLDSLPPEIKNLKCLEALDLLGTELAKLPKEIGELIKLRHLQLSFHQPDSQSATELPGARLCKN